MTLKEIIKIRALIKLQVEIKQIKSSKTIQALSLIKIVIIMKNNNIEKTSKATEVMIIKEDSRKQDNFLNKTLSLMLSKIN